MQEAHNTQEDSIQCDIRLKLGKLTRPFTFCENKMDYHRQADDSSHEPDDNAADETNNTRVLIDRWIEALARLCKDVSQIMQVGNDSSQWNGITKNVRKVKAVCSDVMQQHRLKVIKTLLEK